MVIHGRSSLAPSSVAARAMRSARTSTVDPSVPFVGRPPGKVAERHVARGQGERQRQDQQGAIAKNGRRHKTLLRVKYAPEDTEVQFSWTEINFDTPGSSMVTP
jgi:hypothetical protein